MVQRQLHVPPFNDSLSSFTYFETSRKIIDFYIDSTKCIFPRIRRQNMVNVIASYFEVTDFRETHTMYLLSNTNFSLCDNFNWIDCGGSFEWSTWSETKSSGCQLASRLPTEKDEEARSAVRLFVLRSPAGLFPAKPSKFTAYSTNSSSSLVCLENQTNPSCAIIARKSRN